MRLEDYPLVDRNDLVGVIIGQVAMKSTPSTDGVGELLLVAATVRPGDILYVPRETGAKRNIRRV